MSHYFYKCFDCNTEFDSAFIEDNFNYLCPRCGLAEKEKPLRGVLTVEYDYDSIKKNLSRKKFLSLRAGEISSYPELLPLSYSYKNQNVFDKLNSQIAENIILSSHPATEYTLHNSTIKIFDDTRNPTLSFKDRASIVIALKALQLGITEISAASTGNAGSSLAGICARFGLRSKIFVPQRIPAAKRMQIQIYGADLYIVQGDYDQAFDLCLEVSNDMKWYNRNTAYNSLTIEGKKTSAYDLFISEKGILPEYIFIPSGDGVILAGMYKGFYDLLRLGWIDKLPKLMCVQAMGSDAIIRYTETNSFTYYPADSVADSICAGAPRNLFMSAAAVKTSCGEGIRVSDTQILSAQALSASLFGIIVEPAASASLAGFLKYKEYHDSIDNALLMFTGNGMKDIESLMKNIPKLNSYSSEQIKSFVITNK